MKNGDGESKSFSGRAAEGEFVSSEIGGRVVSVTVRLFGLMAVDSKP
jgi:hypothetical protein